MTERHSEVISRQFERQADVDNAIHTLLEELADKALPHDISLIGAVREVVAAEFKERGIMDEMDFYPFIIA